MAREVVVLSGVRTPIGGYGGSLKEIPPGSLAALCVREAVARSRVAPHEIGHVAALHHARQHMQPRSSSFSFIHRPRITPSFAICTNDSAGTFFAGA